MRITMSLGLACAAWILLAQGSSAQDLTKRQQQALAKGLTWLAKAQHKDGHWEGNNGNYSVALTALAGLALLTEGSTPFEGEYKEELDRAVSWLTAQARKDGRLCDDKIYMHSHGLALLFLAHVHRGCAPPKEAANPKDVKEAVRLRVRAIYRKDLEPVLKNAVAFSVEAQNVWGGWFYVAAAESSGADELNTTALQLQALETARQAGIAVPDASLARARKYLKAAIPVREPGTFSHKPLKKQPPAVTAALAAEFSAGNFDSALVKDWLPFFPKDGSALQFIDLEPYFHFHHAQVMYVLGDKGYAKLIPDSAPPLTWSAYRETLWTRAMEIQNKDGSWSHQVGAVYATASYLVALQLEKGHAPLFRRGKWER